MGAVSEAPPGYTWQMVVGQLLYAVEPNVELDDELAQRLAKLMIERRGFPSGPEVYHWGLSQAVTQEDLLAGQVLPTRHHDAALREFFQRIVRHLDAARPWPPPRWERLSADDWSWRQAPTTAVIKGGLSYVHGRFHHFPDRLADGGEATHVLVLRLRTGEVVALEVLAAPTPADARTRVKVLAGDPNTAVDSMIELAEIRPEDVVRGESDR